MAGEGDVDAQPWTREDRGVRTTLPSGLEDWDYNSRLKLNRLLRVHRGLLEVNTGLEPSDELAVVVTWVSNGSGLRGRLWKRRLAHGGAYEDVEIGCELVGRDLGGVLTLILSVVLDAERSRQDVAVARRPGTVLWSDTIEVSLETSDPLFPLAVESFAALPCPGGAAWYLDVQDDLEAAAMGAVLLLLNKDKPQLVQAALGVARGVGDEQGRLLLEAVRLDVARSLVQIALSDDDFSLEREYETLTLGAALQNLFVGLLGEDDLHSMRMELRDQPALFSARLQSALRLWAT